MHDRYKIFDQEGVHFLTSTIVEWIPVFTEHHYFNIVIESLKYCIENKGLSLYAFVILDNHFHLIASAPKLSDTIGSLRKYSAPQIIDKLTHDKKDWLLNQLSYYKKSYKTNSRHQVWQEGLHPQQILNDDMFRQKAEYIHQNPVERGYVAQAEYWLYSSARNYIFGDNSIVKVNTDLVF